MTFGGRELYPSILDKAAALGYSLIQNHPLLLGAPAPPEVKAVVAFVFAPGPKPVSWAMGN
jgi:hypothetical protein